MAKSKVAGKTPVKKAAGKTPVKKAAGKTPVKKAAGKTPVKKAAGKTPAKKAAAKNPVKKAAKAPKPKRGANAKNTANATSNKPSKPSPAVNKRALSPPSARPKATRHHDPDADLFAVTADDIEALDKDQFRRFLRELMRNEILAYRGSPSDLIDNPGDGTDEGQDLATVRSVALQGSDDDFVPEGETVWQSKAEKHSPSEAELRKEIMKARPTEVLKAQGSYRFLAQLPANNENVTDAKLKKIAVALSYRADQVAFRSQAGLTERARRFPALARLPFFRKPLDKVLHYESWNQRWSMPVFDLAARAGDLKAISEFLASSTRPAHVRVIGPAGVGKTRLVLEALKHAGLSSSAIYAENPASGQFAALFDWIESHKGRAVVVVDECNEQHAAGLRDRAVAQGLPIVLISIGRIEDGGLTSSPRDLRVPVKRMSAKDIVRILKTLVVLDEPTLSQIAHITGGFVKLAKVVADAIALNPALAPQPGALITLDLIDEPLRQMSGFSDRALDWLSLVALFSAIRSDSTAPDSDLALIATFVGAPITDAAGWIDAASTAEVLSDKGNHIFVTPSLLAVHLARRTLKKRRLDLKAWLGQLPQRLQEACASQMAQLRFTDEGKRLAAEVLGTDGPFGNLLAVRQRWADDVFLALGSIAKDEALRQLRASLDASSEEARRVATSDALNHLLFRLLWPSDRFPAAFELLLRLLDASGEHASGKLQRLVSASLQVGLAISRLPFLPRLAIARNEFERGRHSAFTRRLIVRGLASGVGASTGEGYSDSDIEEDGREHWVPRTQQEATECARAATAFVAVALNDAEPEVRAEAAAGLIDHAASLIREGAQPELIAALPAALAIDHRVGRVREELERVLAFDDLDASGESAVRAAIRALPQDLESQIRMLVEGWPLVDNRDEHGLDPRPDPKAVARAIIDSSNRRRYIGFLFEPWAENTYDLFAALSRVPEAVDIWPDVLAAGRASKKSWGPSVLLAIAHDAEVQAFAAIPTTLLRSSDPFDRLVGAEALTKSEATVEELDALTEAVVEGRIEPNSLRYGIFGRWAERRDRTALAALIRAAAAAAGDKSASIALAHAAQDTLALSYDEQAQLVVATMFDVQGHDAWKWEQFAKRVAESAPTRLARSMIERLRSWRANQHGYSNERWPDTAAAHVLEACVAKAPGLAVDVLGLWNVMPYFVEHKLFSAIANPLDVESLVAWASDDARQSALAKIVRPANSPRTDALLVHFGAHSEFAISLQRDLVPRSWNGSLAEILEQRATMVSQWAEDSARSETFRQWAVQAARWLHRAANERKQTEDDEDW